MEETDHIVGSSPLLKQARDVLRRKHYGIRAEAAYLSWLKRYILFHRKRHPNEMSEREVDTFLSHLAVKRRVAVSTQNQARNALVFLYRQVLGRELEQGMDLVHAKRPERLPTVLEKAEVERLLARMQGVTGLIAGLLYGTGLRLIEALWVRVQDLDFGRRQIVVRSGKGNKDRATLLPELLIPDLRDQLRQAKAVHEGDLAEGLGAVLGV